MDSSEIAKVIVENIWEATGYHFVYKKCEKSQTSDLIRTFTFYCAQVKREEAKPKLNLDIRKCRARMTMDHFDCNGYLHITMAEDITFARIRITHHCLHFPYVDISMTDEVDAIIKEQANMPAAKIWETILGRKLEGQLTQKQVYLQWAEINEE
ncbi:hypothetical protein CPB84DRAFT_1691780 [Gymnopilus junonius]|uniref:Uncharacterized protein n=1 Tax=Gymnopilus junonius TaxID=109634 RepID=A0A9P5N8A3_GYMJU|nr:hypothetical protein CPB84DRAFT_1691780 [Gymnopilus junonius]